jgi:hypothetical protein
MVASALTACGEDAVFDDGDDGTGASGASGPLVFEPAPGGVRRLIGVQYLNSVRYLFGGTAVDAVVASDFLPNDEPVSGYKAIGAAQTPPGLNFPEFWDLAAEQVANAVVADPSTLATHVPCINAAQNVGCYEQLAENLGRLAFRRPVTAEEKAWIVGLATEGQAYDGQFMTGVKYAVWGIVESPNFLYVVEVGEPDPEHPGWNRLNAYELAARMSFFLNNTTPDAGLLAAAESGLLDTPEGIQSMAAQLLAREAAEDTVWALFREFLYVDRVSSAQKEPTVYPEFTASTTIRSAMIEEVRLLLEDIVWTRGVDTRELFTANYTFVNEELAEHYGVPAPTSGAWGKVTLPASHGRSGFLTSGAFLARASHAVTTSPTRRGVFVRDRVLCMEVPPPDPSANTVLPQPEPGDPPQTTKDLVEAHLTEPHCAQCHTLFDPLGFAMENFDAVGKYRTNDNGFPIDATGTLPTLGDWEDATSLGQRILEDERDRAGRCIVVNLMRGTLGHLETEGEEAAIVELSAAFAEANYNLQDLLVEMTTSQLFRYVEGPSAN